MSRSATLVFAAALVASATAVALAGRPIDVFEPPSRAPSVVATSAATLSCPESPQDTTTRTTLFAVAPVSSGVAPDDPGKLVVVALDVGDRREVAATSSPGVPVLKRLGGGAASSALLVADGALSQGLTAAEWSPTRGSLASGTAASWCDPAAEEWWFNGVDTSVGSVSRLIVTNPTPALGVVDLTFHGPDGRVEAVGERGIAVAPRSRESIDLARFAPGLDAVTVHVEAVTGRVVAAVHTELMDGASPAGVEWVAPGAAPAATVLVNAGFPGSGDQRLAVTNPGDREALVQVQVVGTSGSFTPTTLKDLRIPPGAVLVEDISDVTRQSGAAVLLESTEPVAGALVDTSEATDDFAVSGTSAALSDPSVVPVFPDTDLAVTFASAVRGGGKVVIESFDDAGSPLGGEELNLRGSTATTWGLRAPRGGPQAAYLVVRVLVDGQTHAVAHYTSKDGITSLPVRPGVLTVTRPDVRATG